jgi:hypothetical protein
MYNEPQNQVPQSQKVYAQASFRLRSNCLHTAVWVLRVKFVDGSLWQEKDDFANVPGLSEEFDSRKHKSV